jgi:hypothetical protein
MFSYSTNVVAILKKIVKLIHDPDPDLQTNQPLVGIRVFKNCGFCFGIGIPQASTVRVNTLYFFAKKYLQITPLLSVQGEYAVVCFVYHVSRPRT